MASLPRRYPVRPFFRMYGAWLIDSIPPATTTSNSSVATAWAASITAFSPEPHILLIVIAPAETGIPAKMPACRAGACPTPAGRTFPMMTCSPSSLPTPLRDTASAMAIAPSFGAGMSANEPRKLPAAVLAAPVMTASFISLSFFSDLVTGDPCLRGLPLSYARDLRPLAAIPLTGDIPDSSPGCGRGVSPPIRSIGRSEEPPAAPGHREARTNTLPYLGSGALDRGPFPSPGTGPPHGRRGRTQTATPLG